MDNISDNSRKFSNPENIERTEKKLKLLYSHLNRLLEFSSLKKYGKLETMSDEEVIRIVEQLTSRCDVSNDSDDLKWKRDMEEEKEKKQLDCENLEIEHKKYKKELEQSKTQVFSLLQKLSCERTEFIDSKEKHKIELNKLTVSYESQNFLLKNEIKELKNSLCDKVNELDVLKDELNALKCSSKKVLKSSKKNLDKNCDTIESNCGIKENHVLKDSKQEKEQTDQMVKELDRLRNHLLTIEETHNMELLESNQENIQLREQLKEKELVISSAFSVQSELREEVKTRKEKSTNDLSDKESEMKELEIKLSSCQSTIQQYSASIINLHSVLEQYEKNQSVLETTEIEKCRRELTLTKQSKLDLSKDLEETRNEVILLKNELCSIKRQGEELQRMRIDYDSMRKDLDFKRRLMDEMERKMTKLKLEEAMKIDKVMMRSLFTGYFQAPSPRRQDVAFVIGRFLDFNADDYDAISSGRSKGVEGKNINMFKDQSFAELFVKFLENESAPSLVTPHDESHKTNVTNTHHSISQNTQHPHSILQNTQHTQQFFQHNSNTNDSSQIPVQLYLQSLKKQQQQQSQISDYQHNFLSLPPNSSPTNHIPNRTNTTLFPLSSTPLNTITTTITTTAPCTTFTTANNINFLTGTISAANKAYQSNNYFSNSIKSV